LTKEQGEKWMSELFEDKKPATVGDVNEPNANESKLEMRKRNQKTKIKENLKAVEQLKK